MECALASPVPGQKTRVSQNRTGMDRCVELSSHTDCSSEWQAYCSKSTSVSSYLGSRPLPQWCAHEPSKKELSL